MKHNDYYNQTIKNDDLVLEKFLKMDWTEEKKSLKNKNLNEFPFVPLDFKMEDKDIKILHEQLKLITKNYKWGIKYLGDGDQAGGDIIWYYGLQSEKNLIERYDEYNTFLEDKNIKNFDQLEQLCVDKKLDWNENLPILKSFIEKIPYKKLYNIEGINYAPNGRAYVHSDKEHFFHSHPDTLYGRLYLPIEWEQDAEFHYYGFGKIPVESGRLYLLNSMQIHGSINYGKEHRYAIKILVDSRTKEFQELLERSKIKFLSTIY